MRKRSFYRVCRCTPDEGVVQLDTHLLHQMVNRSIHAICCAEHCRWKYQRGLLLGNLCLGTGHPYWAIKVWRFVLKLICRTDYDEWIDVPINPESVDIHNVLSETDCLSLGRRIDDLWRAIGHPECADMEAYAQKHYGWFWAEKYDFCQMEFDELIADLEAAEQQEKTETLFREGQGLGSCSGII